MAINSILIPLAFLLANIFLLLVILYLNRRTEDKQNQQLARTRQSLATPFDQSSQRPKLEASDILSWEFEYARTTASEAMQDRYTMINFYLILVGVVASGVVAIFGKDAGLPKATGTLLLWLLCGIGWIYFLKIIRLRQAWHDSARTMGHIKEFYIQHAKDFGQDTLRGAFRWQLHTLPAVNKPWTVFFYSVMLIAFLNSAAFVGGGILLKLDNSSGVSANLDVLPERYVTLLVLLGLLLFTFHIWLYFAFLKPQSSADSTPYEEPQSLNVATTPSAATGVDDANEKVKILELTEECRAGELFRITCARLQYRRFDGQMSTPVTRYCFERGDSVGVLLYDSQADAVVLVRQFRYPVYTSLDLANRFGEGVDQAWLLEIVAGVMDAGQTIQEAAHRELLEEAGYKVKGALQSIMTVYPSPGGTSERIHLFWGEVNCQRPADQGGGLVAEGEDTQVVVLPFSEAMDIVARGEICDAKTIIALQYLALRKGAPSAKSPA